MSVQRPGPGSPAWLTTDRARKLSLSRRACLRGLGVSLALPWLEAMAPRTARAAGKPLRFLTVFAPHGMHMPAWTPRTTGPVAPLPATLPPILAPLAPLRADFSVLSGLANYPASITSEEFAGSHARGTGALLTQTPLRFTSSSNIQNGVSLDQMIAKQIKDRTRLPSLEVGVSAGSATGSCEDGYSCAYLHNISWNSPTTFAPKEVSPRAIWNRLFSGPGARPVPPPTPPGEPAAPAGPAQPDRQVIYRKGLLDVVRGDAVRLNGLIGRRDRAKLDEYLTSVDELQRRIVGFETPAEPGAPPPPSAAVCDPGAAPADGRPSSYQQHLELLSDLIVLAFQCDVTRVATFMQEDPFNSRSFSFLGVSGNHHNLSHHGGDSAKHAALQKIDTFEVTQLARLLSRMAAVTEADGQSLLYNSIVLFTSDFGDGDDHYHWDLPVLVAGHAGGRWKPGRHITYPHRGSGGPSNKTDMPMANLFLSILQAFDLPATTFGTDGQAPYGTRPLTELA